MSATSIAWTFGQDAASSGGEAPARDRTSFRERSAAVGREAALQKNLHEAVKERQELAKRYAAKDEKCNELRDKLKATKAALACRERELDMAQRMLQKMGAERMRLQDDAAESKLHTRKLEIRLEQLDSAADISDKYKAAKQEVIQLQQQLLSATSELGACRQVAEQRQKEINVLHRALETHASELSQEKGQDVTAQLLHSLAESREESLEFAKQLAVSKAEVHKLKASASRLSLRVEAAELVRAEAEVAAEQLRQRLEKLVGTSQEISKHKADMAQLLVAARQEAEGLKSERDELADLVLDMQQEIEQLKATAAQATQSSQLAAAAADDEALQQLVDTHAAAADAQQQRQQHEAALHQRCSRLADQASQMEAALRKQLQAAQEAAAARQQQVLVLESQTQLRQARELQLERQIAELQATVDRLGWAVNSAQQAADRTDQVERQVVRLEASLRVADVERQQLQQRLQQLVDDAAVQQQEAQQEMDGLRVQLAAKEAAHRCTLEDVAQLQRQLKQLNQQLDKASKAKAQLQQNMLSQITNIKEKLQHAELQSQQQLLAPGSPILQAALTAGAPKHSSTLLLRGKAAGRAALIAAATGQAMPTTAAVAAAGTKLAAFDRRSAAAPVLPSSAKTASSHQRQSVRRSLVHFNKLRSSNTSVATANGTVGSQSAEELAAAARVATIAASLRQSSPLDVVRRSLDNLAVTAAAVQPEGVCGNEAAIASRPNSAGHMRPSGLNIHKSTSCDWSADITAQLQPITGDAAGMHTRQHGRLAAGVRILHDCFGHSSSSYMENTGFKVGMQSTAIGDSTCRLANDYNSTGHGRKQQLDMERSTSSIRLVSLPESVQYNMLLQQQQRQGPQDYRRQQQQRQQQPHSDNTDNSEEANVIGSRNSRAVIEESATQLADDISSMSWPDILRGEVTLHLSPAERGARPQPAGGAVQQPQQQQRQHVQHRVEQPVVSAAVQSAVVKACAASSLAIARGTDGAAVGAQQPHARHSVQGILCQDPAATAAAGAAVSGGSSKVDPGNANQSQGGRGWLQQPVEPYSPSLALPATQDDEADPYSLPASAEPSTVSLHGHSRALAWQQQPQQQQHLQQSHQQHTQQQHWAGPQLQQHQQGVQDGFEGVQAQRTTKFIESPAAGATAAANRASVPAASGSRSPEPAAVATLVAGRRSPGSLSLGQAHEQLGEEVSTSSLLAANRAWEVIFGDSDSESGSQGERGSRRRSSSSAGAGQHSTRRRSSNSGSNQHNQVGKHHNILQQSAGRMHNRQNRVTSPVVSLHAIGSKGRLSSQHNDDNSRLSSAMESKAAGVGSSPHRMAVASPHNSKLEAASAALQQLSSHSQQAGSSSSRLSPRSPNSTFAIKELESSSSSSEDEGNRVGCAASKHSGQSSGRPQQRLAASGPRDITSNASGGSPAASPRNNRFGEGVAAKSATSSTASGSYGGTRHVSSSRSSDAKGGNQPQPGRHSSGRLGGTTAAEAGGNMAGALLSPPSTGKGAVGKAIARTFGMQPLSMQELDADGSQWRLTARRISLPAEAVAQQQKRQHQGRVSDVSLFSWTERELQDGRNSHTQQARGGSILEGPSQHVQQSASRDNKPAMNVLLAKLQHGEPTLEDLADLESLL